MKVIQIRTTPLPSACYGVACHQHKDCARYYAVNGSQADPKTMGTCLKGGERPGFLALERAAA